MDAYVLGFDEVDADRSPLVGGKGAHLAALARVEGVLVPTAFCVTTDAYRRFLAAAPSLDGPLAQLEQLRPGDRDAIGEASAGVRQILEETAIPDDVAASIARAVASVGEDVAWAIRSSATAEDLPTASFAGQLDSFLNVVGTAAVLEHVRRCWASLFSERAVTYRLRNGVDPRDVEMAVVVQRMVFADAAGVLFTADPATGHRKVASIEATLGLGDPLVAGRVNADLYKVRDGAIVERAVAAKAIVHRAAPEGGARDEPLDPRRQNEPALTDAQVLALERLGRRIESFFGSPQDIEWCLEGDVFHVVQSRPITTLFPTPVAPDETNRVYLSVSHQQMMTDAMRPLGLSLFQLTALRPMAEAGGRLFVDVTPLLTSPARTGFLKLMERSDPLIADALQSVVDRGDFLSPPPGVASAGPAGPPPGVAPPPLEADLAIIEGLIARSEESVASLKRDLRATSGPARIELMLRDLDEQKRLLADPQSHQAVMAGMEAAWWLNEHLETWLGEKNAADGLTLSVPYNVTAEMGLALLDVADAIRPHPEVVAFLQSEPGDALLDELPRHIGGEDARRALQGWLERYGMRGIGEFDFTRPRFVERPSSLLPVLLGHVRSFEPGEAARRFEAGRRQAEEKERDLLARLRALPDGERKADDAKRNIDRLRTFMGYREYPKYGMVCRSFLYKQAILEEAERLVEGGALRDREDVFFLTFAELGDAFRDRRVDDELLRERKAAFRFHQTLTPPRVLTSDGEAVTGRYRGAPPPPGALPGLAGVAGTVEGRARIILDVDDAQLEEGDILVTTYTDPSWTPLFLGIRGLVTEVGGRMAHGTVIAREYGLPAVVGVEGATRRILDGQRIRVNGTEGYVELLSSSDRSEA